MNSDYLTVLEDLSKSRAEKKKEEYLKKLKEKKKKNKKKKDKKEEIEIENHLQTSLKKDEDDMEKLMKEENIEIEYVDEDLLTKPNLYENFKNVFDYFVVPTKKENLKDDDYNEEDWDENYDNFEENKENINLPEVKLSKKKKKMLSKIKISQLKALTDRPEVVEAWDVTAQDPYLLVKMKSLKNTIPVPKHWSQKRKFLQNKRGILKPPFKLPDFIEGTGIGKIRDNTSNDRKSLKQKMREKMQPKLGKMDIDYGVLHDAFFRYQTKPSLSVHGDIYYENKEFENKMKFYKPGRISEKLRVALGILENSPPPWIVNMQRYGPPPSYPNLKIPGVNAPLLDPTADVTPNLWTPPVEESNRVLVYDFSRNKNEEEHWGDLREVEEDEFSEDLEEDVSIADENETRPNVENLFSGMDADLSSEFTKSSKFMISEETISTSKDAVPNPNANIVYPNMIKNENSFYTILEQKDENIKKNEIYGSSFGYVIPKENEENTEEEKQTNKKEEFAATAVAEDKVNKVNEKKKEKKLPNFKF